MITYKKTIALVSLCLGAGIYNFMDISLLEAGAVCFSLYSFIIYLYTIGKRINVLELVVFVFSVQLLFMPVITYAFNPKPMAVDSQTYLLYTLPAVVALALGFELALYKTDSHEQLIQKVKEGMNDKGSLTLMLFFIGLAGTALTFVVPVSLKRIADLIANSLYISVLYSYYSKLRFKYLILIVTLSLMVLQTVREGMFNHFFYWGLLWMSFISVGKRWANTMVFKVSLVAAGLAFIVVMQAVKFEYRQSTWGNKLTERRSDPELMQKLMVDKITNFDSQLNTEILLSAFGRLNEGYYVANAMSYVPHFEPYADGELLLHFLYPFIPRLVWSDKPITGGFANMSRFTNIVNTENTSSNISPVGEAYVNFGPTGGIIFIFFFGLLFSFIFQYIIKLSLPRPSLILWLPNLYVGLITGSETDVLTIWGTFVTASIFLIVFIGMFKRLNINL